MRGSAWGLMLLVGCKATIADAPPDARTGDGNGSGDAMSDGTLPLGPWSTPQKIPQASSATLVEDDVTLSSSTLEMVFAVVQPNGTKDLMYASRPSVADPWTAAGPVPFNTTTSDETPRFSADDRTLYFASGRASGNGTLDIFQITRTGLDNTSWGTLGQVPGVNSAVTEKWFMPCGPAGYYLEVRANGANGTDFYEGTLGGAGPTLVPQLSSPQSEISTFMTPDCLTVYFASARVNPEGIFIAHRTDSASPWQAPAQVTDFASTGGNQEDPYLSNDGRTFVFASDAAGTKDIYISTR